MKLINQVCNIEQGKRLMELGVTKGLFEHVQSMGSGWGVRLTLSIDTDDLKLTYPAYTVAELGAILKPVFNEEGKVSGEVLEELSKKYEEEQLGLIFSPLFLADYVILLIEKGIITAEECNNRLNNA